MDENERSVLKGLCESEETSLLSMAGTDKVDDLSTYILLKKFFKWCAFDLEKEVNELFDNLYSNERVRKVVQLRARKETLEQIGGTLSVTRERVRQIEAKAKKLFSRLYSQIRIISKISAERNVYFQKKFVSVTENPKPIVTGCLKYSHFRDIITKRVFCEQGGLYGCNI